MIKNLINNLKKDYTLRTLSFTIISLIITIIFALYNGILGIIYNSLFNGSTCVYYLLLILIRIFLLALNKKQNIHKIIIYLIYSILFLITLAMIIPALLMVQNERKCDLDLIAGIAMATYTTYSLVVAIINLKKVQKHNDLSLKLIRLVNLLSTLMSILVLQNTLILVNGSFTSSMQILSFISSIAIILLNLIIIIISFSRTLKN